MQNINLISREEWLKQWNEAWGQVEKGGNVPVYPMPENKTFSQLADEELEQDFKHHQFVRQ